MGFSGLFPDIGARADFFFKKVAAYNFSHAR
jgi:hypothetical protein